MQPAQTGYEIIQRCFSNQECNELLTTLASVSRSRAGARHLMANTAVAAVANDPRLIDLVRPWLGNDAIPFRATLFEKSFETNWLISWRQDTPCHWPNSSISPVWGPWSVKAGVNYAHAPASVLTRVIALRLHLDQSAEENGPLRVIPGSYRAGVLSDKSVMELVSAAGYIIAAWSKVALLRCGR